MHIHHVYTALCVFTKYAHPDQETKHYQYF